MEFVTSTYTFLWRTDIETAIGEIAKAGFRRVEVLAAPPHVDAGEWQGGAAPGGRGRARWGGGGGAAAAARRGVRRRQACRHDTGGGE